MAIEFTVPFTTKIYFDAPHIYKTTNLWKTPNKDILKYNDINIPESASNEEKSIIYALPDNLENLTITEYCQSKDTPSVVNLSGFTTLGYIEPTNAICIAASLTTFKSLNDEQKKVFNDLSREFDVDIILTEKPIYIKDILNNDANNDDSLYITLLGKISHVEACLPHLQISLDILDKTRERFVQSLELESYSLLPLCTGINMSIIESLSKTYHCNIYLPSFSNIPDDIDVTPTIFFSSTVKAMTLTAKIKLETHIQKIKENLFFQRFSNISPLKLLFIKNFYDKTIKKLMNKFQSFITVTESFIEFQSPSVAILDVVTKIFTIQVLHNIVEIQMIMNDTFKFNDNKNLLTNLFKISSESKISLMQFSDVPNQLVFCIDHTSINIKRDYVDSESASFTNEDILNNLKNLFNKEKLFPFMKQLRAIFEIHPDFEEFISGKKNGKLTRIMELSSCLLSLEMNEGDENMFLNVISDSFEDFQKGFHCFTDELPSEDSFFIPEVYHRPVIGAGGSVIQTTMKKHNVFIQFSNSFFLPQNEFSHIRYDNVIIRCPHKNVMGIEMAKLELKELAKNYSSTQYKTFLRFSPGQYRFILEHGNDYIGQIEKNMNVYILFPTEEPSEGYELEIRGNNDNSMVAAQKLISLCFGSEKELILSSKLNIDDPKLFIKWHNEIIIPLKYSLNTEVTVSEKLIRLTYHKDNDINVRQSIDLLNEYLLKQNNSIKERRNIEDFISRTDTPEKTGDDPTSLLNRNKHDAQNSNNQHNNYMSNNVNNGRNYNSPTKNRVNLNSAPANQQLRNSSIPVDVDMDRKKFNVQYPYTGSNNTTAHANSNNTNTNNENTTNTTSNNKFNNGYMYDHGYEENNTQNFSTYPYNLAYPQEGQDMNI
ncbi:hypothetical protein TBLA_0A08490 [Henningerozyma blattae CBS 6284]|uniref:K Homology domain-containing protein n=1 Tax=Henningerozyma blattae (strain ATCC 34711 / CBS 6284 / DSM 70876 / NBRC 10599 / NRRL Y-10934 / UCD 77-7) TaxID=1071380 RepID=I2GWY6_HENB6|nr:hypothetical protein TBLA_0A08490 [Tetrapisispora blattae CBS 6284]CCH58638.1 hypothetical protein TBLA_0A08490 [Tetrapisispora blattae CBS 6284]